MSARAHKISAVEKRIRAQIQWLTASSSGAGRIAEGIRPLATGLAARWRTDPVRATAFAVAGVAAAMCGWALLWPAPTLGSYISAGAPQVEPTDETAAHFPSDHSPVLVSALLERPLFRRDRRPAPVPVPPPQRTGPTEVEKTAARRAVLSRYTLSGTVITDEYKAAILSQEGEVEMILVKEGDPMEGWKIDQVAPRAVTLRNGSETAQIMFPAVD